MSTNAVAVQTISAQELKQRLDAKRSFEFWNVLTDEYFKGENISGSRRVPLDKIGAEVRDNSIPKATEIVVYCAGPACPQSRLAAEKLAKLGYERVQAYEGGLEEWKVAGFPTERV
jgi:rhodanese-related sulfurtransferase